ncbi:MAG: hypothetical protein FWH18_07150 [Marinilabiliaceae bacterium]|nr:hypothetical protein [Marinilabiliaceae bacterium]
MAMPIRAIPVLEGAAARRFIKEAKANEKRRGTMRFSEEEMASCRAILEDARKHGTIHFD